MHTWVCTHAAVATKTVSEVAHTHISAALSQHVCTSKPKRTAVSVVSSDGATSSVHMENSFFSCLCTRGEMTAASQRSVQQTHTTTMCYVHRELAISSLVVAKELAEF